MGTGLWLTAIAAVVLIVAALGWEWGRAMWGRAWDRPIKLGAMMERLGIAPERVAEGARRGQVVAAARRCAECRNEPVCEEWLAGRDDRPLEQFCPNARLLETLKA